MNLRLSIGPHLLDRESTRSIMGDVLIALAPATAAGVYLFGLRAGLVLAVAVASALVSEFIWQKLMKKPIRVGDLSAVVTGLIMGLNLPASAPLWLAAIGSAVAIILIKELFGGIGHNFMNPAMLGRAFLLASWPVRMTAYTLPVRLLGASAAKFSADVVASATPLKASGWQLYDLALGNIPGTIGEVSKIAIVIGLIYLLMMRTISWHIPVSFLGTTALLTWLLGGDPLLGLMTGGILFGAVFMATDYATSPVYGIGKLLFGIGCGIIVVVIRKYGNYPEGVTFAILFMNCVSPLIDRFTVCRVYGTVKKHA